MLKLPVNSTPLSIARLYAIDSFNYTHDHEGFEDEKGTNSKLRRIQIGRFGQEWITEFCKINNIHITADKTSAKENDIFDINILGKNIDVKTSASTIPCQCNKLIERKNNIDLFVFMKTDNWLSCIEPICIIPFDYYFQNALLIKEGELFPQTNIKNKFKRGSYVLQEPEIYGGQPVINTLVKVSQYGWDSVYTKYGWNIQFNQRLTA